MLLFKRAALLLVCHLMKLGFKPWGAVDVIVCAHVMPLPGHDQVALEIHEHYKNNYFIEDAGQNANILRQASWTTELSKADYCVDASVQNSR